MKNCLLFHKSHILLRKHQSQITRASFLLAAAGTIVTSNNSYIIDFRACLSVWDKIFQNAQSLRPDYLHVYILPVQYVWREEKKIAAAFRWAYWKMETVENIQSNFSAWFIYLENLVHRTIYKKSYFTQLNAFSSLITFVDKLME